MDVLQLGFFIETDLGGGQRPTGKADSCLRSRISIQDLDDRLLFIQVLDQKQSFFGHDTLIYVLPVRGLGFAIIGLSLSVI